ATELVLAREQHLSQLDGLAAAAAHELGTPLATITLIAKELQLAIKPDSEHADDVRLLNEQAKRCRAILAKLTELSSGAPLDRIGEPYVTNRRRQGVDGEASGLGLGFFIAKTLLERSGATLDFKNRAFPDRGAIVSVRWGRNDFERAVAFAS